MTQNSKVNQDPQTHMEDEQLPPEIEEVVRPLLEKFIDTGIFIESENAKPVVDAIKEHKEVEKQIKAAVFPLKDGRRHQFRLDGNVIRIGDLIPGHDIEFTTSPSQRVKVVLASED